MYPVANITPKKSGNCNWFCFV